MRQLTTLCKGISHKDRHEPFLNVPLGGIIKNRRVFKTRHFARWMRKTELTDALLCVAVHEMSQGLIDADLGRGLIKKRVALASRGKRSGARTLLATNKHSRWFFVFGFEKNERTNVSVHEQHALQELAEELLTRSHEELEHALADGALQEICHER